MTELANGLWEHFWADLSEPLLSQEYVLVMQCLYPYFPVAEIVISRSASAIILAMYKIMTSFGIPYKLGTDNGPPFNNQDFANFAKHMGYQRTRVTLYAPWTKGMVEHFMRN